MRPIRIGRSNESDIIVTRFGRETAHEVVRFLGEKSRVVILSFLAPAVNPNARVSESQREIANYPQFLAELLRINESAQLIYLTTTLLDRPTTDTDVYLQFMKELSSTIEDLGSDRAGYLQLPRIFGSNEPESRAIADWVANAVSGKDIFIQEPCRQRALLALDDAVSLVCNAIDIADNQLESVLAMQPLHMTNNEIGKAIVKLANSFEISVTLNLDHKVSSFCKVCSMDDAAEVIHLRGKLAQRRPIKQVPTAKFEATLARQFESVLFKKRNGG
jgi:hypothetical protein